MATQHRPAVLVVDVHLPDRDTVETLTALRAASPAAKLLALVDAASPRTTAAVLTAGADGSLAKDRSSGQVAAIVRKLAAGEQAGWRCRRGSRAATHRGTVGDADVPGG